MKLTILFTALLTALAGATPVELAWDPNSETNLEGYKLYLQQRDEPTDPMAGYTVIETLGLVTGATIELPDGSHKLVVTAFNDIGLESLPSNVLELQVLNGKVTTKGRPGRPGGLKHKFKWWWANL